MGEIDVRERVMQPDPGEGDVVPNRERALAYRRNGAAGRLP